jgi:FkbM family methyltransferase
MVETTAKLRRELDGLLAESPASARNREQETFDRAIDPFGRRLVLSGAGNLGRKAAAVMRRHGITPVAFVDNNPELWGTTIDGVPVHSQPEGAELFGQSATFCVTIWGGQGIDGMADRRKPLIDLGCANVIDFGAMFWKFGSDLLPHYSMDLPHKVLEAAADVRRAYDVWHDDASRNEYVAHVRWRLHLDFDNLPPPVTQDIYFPADLFKLIDEEVFVDCGAYDGDTVRSFIARNAGSFRGVYAFEADERNFAKLKNYVSLLPADLRRRIWPIDKALADRPGTLHFSSTGTAAAAVSDQGTEVACVTLDDEVTEAPTYIKMDIEGSEPAALRGAKRIIARHAPILSVCVYHAQNHLWSIPLQIASSRPDYRMFLRPHVPESWDLVCYAIPPSRALS